MFDYHKPGGKSSLSFCYHEAGTHIKPRLGICQHPGLGKVNQFSGLSLLHLERKAVVLTVYLLERPRDSTDNIGSYCVPHQSQKPHAYRTPNNPGRQTVPILYK